MDEPEPRPYLAEWWPRVGATLLDGVIITVIAFVTAILAAAAGGSDDTVGAVWLIAWFVLGSAYLVGTMARKGKHNGQTIGKQAADIRVVRNDGRPIRLGLSVVREVLLKYILANLILGIGWIIDSVWPLGDRENRAIHDMIVKTHVVSSKPRQPQLVQQPAARPPVARPALAPPIARH
ncbi:MAG TPA: RDD family protein, partial [Solirubrobacter sp.]